MDDPYSSEQVHGPVELADIGDLALEEGVTLRGCQLASGSHGVMRDIQVAPGRAVEPGCASVTTSSPRSGC